MSAICYFSPDEILNVAQESECNAGDTSSIPGLGRSPGEGNGNPLQYSCLGNRMDRGVWWATWGHRVRYNLVTEHVHEQDSEDLLNPLKFQHFFVAPST